MTNYNERLDEILERHGMYAVLKDENRFDDAAMEREFPAEVGPDKTKQAISSLFKELVAEAKPKDYVDYYANDPIERGRKISYDEAVREFEQNLLKALDEK